MIPLELCGYFNEVVPTKVAEMLRPKYPDYTFTVKTIRIVGKETKICLFISHSANIPHEKLYIIFWECGYWCNHYYKLYCSLTNFQNRIEEGN